ncbi:MAG: PGN_0703 family putative restriction endonuclease [Phycisphaeraceae bacterium]
MHEVKARTPTVREESALQRSINRSGCNNSVRPPSDPYGLHELDPKLRISTDGLRVSCVVKGCPHQLTPPSRKGHRGSVCPAHGIRVHKSRTYSYADYRRNLIIDEAFFDHEIRHHPFKYESHRFGLECSEDALTWNVFRSFQRHRQLARIAELITHIPLNQEPRLFLWGLELNQDNVTPWDLLIHARDRFEADLPVQRPKTEPDIGLWVPGQLLILIEAKFTSTNPTYRIDRTKLLDLTLGQLLQIYQWKGMRLLSLEEARKREEIAYQLWRNLVFSENMANADATSTKAYVANLVREGYETEVCEPILTMMNLDRRDRFEQVSWEQLYRIAAEARMADLCRYMEQKAARLRPAFKIP